MKIIPECRDDYRLILSEKFAELCELASKAEPEHKILYINAMLEVYKTLFK